MGRFVPLIYLLGLALAAGAPSAVAAARSGDPTAQQALAILNAERAANGLPADVVENPDWSSKCAAHDRYMIENDVMTHPEDPSKPGYSVDGNWAGTSSVLADYPGGWKPGVTPWEDAPIHLAQILAPELQVAGVAVFQGRACLTTWPGYVPDQETDGIDVFPGDGRTGVVPREVAAELPFTPGEKLGIPAGTATGPYLLVYAVGHWQLGDPLNGQPWLATITAASLTGPDGPVELLTVDRSNPDVGPYLPWASGMLIPVAPLTPHARYTARVTMSNSLDTLTRTWSFTTGSASTSPSSSGASVQIVALVPGALTVSYETPAPHGTLAVYSAGRLVARRTLPRSSGRLLVRLPQGAVLSRLRVCVAGGGSTAKSCESTR